MKAKDNCTTKDSKFSFYFMISSVLILSLVMALYLKGDHPLAEPIYSRISAPAGEFLAPFLISRVSGSAGSRQLQQFLLEKFNHLGWHQQVDRFSHKLELPGSHALGGTTVEFANLIFTKNIYAKQRLVLAAHYDSKYHVSDQQYPGQFIGATDSAWPCALLLELAHVLNEWTPSTSNLSLQIIFFDGEEAFHSWSHEDSLYGSRHLAALWGSPSGVLPSGLAGPGASPFSVKTIELFILFDLLGSADPTIPNFFKKTLGKYQRLANIELNLRQQGKLRSIGGKPIFSQTPVSYDVMYGASGLIDDDHVPFMKRNVPILHLIPYPFPKCWHSIKDNVAALDNNAIHDLALIFYHFIKTF